MGGRSRQDGGRQVRGVVNSATLTLCKSCSEQVCGSARVCRRRQLVVEQRRWAIRTGARQIARGLSVSAARRVDWPAVGAVQEAQEGVYWVVRVKVKARCRERYGGVTSGMGGPSELRTTSFCA